MHRLLSTRIPVSRTHACACIEQGSRATCRDGGVGGRGGSEFLRGLGVAWRVIIGKVSIIKLDAM